MLPAKPQEILKNYRKFLGLTQLQLAFQMGTTSNSVARWESGWPVTQATLNHVKALVERRLRDDILKVFSQINPVSVSVTVPLPQSTYLFSLSEQGGAAPWIANPASSIEPPTNAAATSTTVNAPLLKPTNLPFHMTHRRL